VLRHAPRPGDLATGGLATVRRRRSDGGAGAPGSAGQQPDG
jgi:hypothetical protein